MNLSSMFFQKLFLYTKMFKKLKKFISNERINTAIFFLYFL